MESEVQLNSTVDSSEHDIVKSDNQEVIGLFLAPQQVFSSTGGVNTEFHSDHTNTVTVLTNTSGEQSAAEQSSANSSRTDSMLHDDITTENQSGQDTEEYSNSDHHGNLTANDLVSSAVAVVSSDPGTVYLDQSGVALAELLPGTVSLPSSGAGEATFVHHGNGGNVVIATESGSYDGIAMATISHTSPTMATEQQLAALSQFTSNIEGHHVTDHDHHATLYVLEDPSDDQHHESSLLKKSYPCDVVGCTKQFSTPYRLKAHIRSHTGDMFECESHGCEKAFITQSDLNKHIKTHSGMKPFHCGYEGCGKVYTTAHHLKVHERSHSGEKPYKCTYSCCGKAFATGYGLKSHTRTHTGEKPYTCPDNQCNKAFKTSGDLQKHIRTHTGERPFKCLYESCNRSFTTSNIRKVHMRTHTGERPYVCEYEGCSKSFASATNYKNHTRIHTGERPYVCQVEGCKKSFTEYSSLYKHHVVHTHNKPYTCSVCDKTYRQASTLALHKRTAHGDMSGVTMAEATETFVSSSDEPSLKRPRLEFTSNDNGHTYSMVMSSDDTSAVAAMQAINTSLGDIGQQISDVTTGHITIPVTITTDSQLQGVPVVITETPPNNIMQESGNDADMTSQSVSLVTSGYSTVSKFISADNVAYVYATMATVDDAETHAEVSSSNVDITKPAYQELPPTIDNADSTIKIVKSNFDRSGECPEDISEQVITEDFNDDDENISPNGEDKNEQLHNSVVSSNITEIHVGNML